MMADCYREHGACSGPSTLPHPRPSPELFTRLTVADLAGERATWQHNWEKSYLESTYDSIYPNTLAMIERVMREVGEAYGTRFEFEFECHDIGHLYTLQQFARRGLIQPPCFILTTSCISSRWRTGCAARITASPSSA